MTTPPEFPAEQPLSTPSNLANWGIRAAGWVIDYLPILILEVIFYRTVFLGTLVGLAGIAYWLYLGYMEGITGQTPGKAIMGLRLVNASGNVIGSGAGIARKLAHFIDSLVFLLGWLLPIVDSKRQTIADKIMNSYVVEGVEKRAFSVDLWLPPKQAT